MLEQALKLSSSTMVNSTSQGTTTSLSSHQSRPNPPPLKKTLTQLQLISEGGTIRSHSVDTNLPPAPLSKSNHWIPDYTLKAVTDLLYLKVRKNTFLVAVKASKMESMNSSNGLAWRDEEIDEVLIKITENDDDFCLRDGKQYVKSPDMSCSVGVSQSKVGTPSCSRRESVWSTFSMIKAKFGGKSNTSIENIREEKFWEGFNNNKVSARNCKDLSEQAKCLSSVPTRQASVLSDNSMGRRSLTVRNIREELVRNVSDASDQAEYLPEMSAMMPHRLSQSNHKLVRTDTCNTASSSPCDRTSSSPCDRTSLLQPE